MKNVLLPLEEGDADWIDSQIQEYDESVVPPEQGVSEEDIVLKIDDDEGNVIAGCILDIDKWKIASIDILWVDERYRRQGRASALIREAERMAREKGCKLSVLGAFDFQGRPFYEKHEYRLCGVIEDWPKGHCHYAMMKRLDRPLTGSVPPKVQKGTDFEIKVGDEDDSKVICDGLGAHNRSQIPPERG